jgi:hypothetical protein
VARSSATAVAEAEAALGKPAAATWSWYEFLTRYCSAKVSAAVFTRLIQVGALRWTGMLAVPRWRPSSGPGTTLTDKEREWVALRATEFDGLVPALKALGTPRRRKAKPNRRRVPKKGKEAVAAAAQARLDRALEGLAQCANSEEIGEDPGPEQWGGCEQERKAAEAELAEVTKWVSDPAPAPEPAGPEGGCSSVARESAVQSAARLLEYPPSPRVDTPLEIADHEEELLGISITCGRIDACDISAVNTSCRDFLAGKNGFMILGVEIQAVREVRTKKGAAPGSKMAFLTVADQSCSLEDVVCFPETWKEYRHVLTDGNTVIVQAARDFKDPKSSALHVKKVWQATQALGLSA